MPIGKNSLKRVTGGAKAEAPTAETSAEVKEKKASEVKPTAKKATPKKVEKVEAPTPKKNEKKVEKAPSAKAPAKKSAPKKSMESEPELSPVKTAEKVVAKKTESRQGDGYVNLGGELPDFLL